MGFTRQQMTDIEEVIERTLAKENVLKSLEKTIAEIVASSVKETVQEMLGTIKQMSEEIDNLKKENKSLRKKTEDRVVGLEQYSRRNNLRFFGVPEESGENIEHKVGEIIAGRMNVALPDFAIDRCHRIGNHRDNRSKPRQIVVKFTSYKFRSLVFSNKKLLKGSKIIVAEDLCSARQTLYQEARDKFGNYKVWTRDGAVLVKSASGAIKKVFAVDELDKLN